MCYIYASIPFRWIPGASYVTVSSCWRRGGVGFSWLIFIYSLIFLDWCWVLPIYESIIYCKWWEAYVRPFLCAPSTLFFYASLVFMERSGCGWRITEDCNVILFVLILVYLMLSCLLASICIPSQLYSEVDFSQGRVGLSLSRVCFIYAVMYIFCFSSCCIIMHLCCEYYVVSFQNIFFVIISVCSDVAADFVFKWGAVQLEKK